MRLCLEHQTPVMKALCCKNSLQTRSQLRWEDQKCLTVLALQQDCSPQLPHDTAASCELHHGLGITRAPQQYCCDSLCTERAFVTYYHTCSATPALPPPSSYTPPTRETLSSYVKCSALEEHRNCSKRILTLCEE